MINQTYNLLEDPYYVQMKHLFQYFGLPVNHYNRLGDLYHIRRNYLFQHFVLPVNGFYIAGTFEETYSKISDDSDVEEIEFTEPKPII